MSTNEYGISFQSQSFSKTQAFNHFPPHHDKEAYTETTSPSLSECYQLTAFWNANWGGQFGSAVEYDTTLELSKFRSLLGFLIWRSGGPIVWKSIRQNQTALISCGSEIMATNECTTELQSLKHCVNDLVIPEGYSRTK